MSMLLLVLRFAAALLALLAAAPAMAEPAMWRVSDDDTQMLLFGSVHVLPQDTDWRSEALDAAFAGAHTLVLETDLDEASHGPANRLSEANTWLPRGERLADHLTQDEQARLSRAARSVGVPPDAIAAMRPWMASLLLSLRFAEEAGQDPEAGVDRRLMEEARDGGKRLAYLESPEDQIAVFAGLPRDAEVRMLTATVDEILDTPDVLEAMDDAWLDGDIAALEALTLDTMKLETPELYQAAMLDRNHAWAPELDAMMGPPGQILVVVGAAHMVGPDGLPSLMEARGYAVERVR